MSPTSSTSTSEEAAQASYAPFAQLVKMLAPSSGSIALYDRKGDLIWCSDGFERPDLREIVDELMAGSAEGGRASVRNTSSGIATYASLLTDSVGNRIGLVIVELGQAEQAAVAANVTLSLLRPVLECLQSRLALELAVDQATSSTIVEPATDLATSASIAGSPVETGSDSDNLDLLLQVDAHETTGAAPLQQLVAHCVTSLNCVGGALVIPEKNISEVADGEFPDGEQMLDRTRRHLLAWAQLNDRPMVVNRVGNDQPYKILSCPVRDAEHRVTGLLALFRSAQADNFEIRDVRILEFMSRKAVGILSHQHDPLTGLINRGAFERRVQTLLDSDAEAHAVLYIDVDRLQLINDAFGYQAGDEVIQRLGEVVRNELSDVELATRMGGDRFAIFLPRHDAARATATAGNILRAMSQLGYVNGAEAVPVSVSIGLAASNMSRQDIRHLLAAAEIPCKRAKQLGGGRLEVCTDTSLDALVRRSELLASASLQQALKNNEFRLEAQPIVSLAPGGPQTLGFEILVRMRDSDGQLVAPDKFVNAAERYGLMPALDKWVVSATARALSGASSLLADLPLGVAINLSSQTLRCEDFAEFAMAEFEQAGLSPASFCFELKESAAVNHMREAEQFIEVLGKAGCGVVLDDFGHALTSLSHLKHLKVRHLKIDGRLARRVLDDVHAESMVGGLCKAAQTLGVKTVAEHVESEPLAAKLRELEVDYGQGYFFGRPVPLARALSEAEQVVPVASAAHS